MHTCCVVRFHLDFLTDLDFFIFRDESFPLLVHVYPTGIAKGSESKAPEEEHRCWCWLLLLLVLLLSHVDLPEDDEPCLLSF